MMELAEQLAQVDIWSIAELFFDAQIRCNAAHRAQIPASLLDNGRALDMYRARRYVCKSHIQLSRTHVGN